MVGRSQHATRFTQLTLTVTVRGGQDPRFTFRPCCNAGYKKRLGFDELEQCRSMEEASMPHTPTYKTPNSSFPALSRRINIHSHRLEESAALSQVVWVYRSLCSRDIMHRGLLCKWANSRHVSTRPDPLQPTRGSKDCGVWKRVCGQGIPPTEY